MSKEIQTEISIEGKKITHFSSIIINQQFNAHHTFQLIVRHEVLEEMGSHSIESSQDYIGKRITISFGERSSADTIFKGLITEVGVQHSQGLWGNIVLKGYSPTYLLEGGDHNDSYYKKTLETIIKEVTDKLSVHDMKLVIKPTYTKTLDYTCQYQESNFNFINRLAAEYGEWFYYNGEELFFGKPDDVSTLELLYGEQVEDMSFSMRVIPMKVAHYSYNSGNDTLIKTNTPDRTESSNDYVKHALSVSDNLFTEAVSQFVKVRTADKHQLDEYAKKQKGIKAAATVVLTAHGDHPKVKLGCAINLKVAQKEIQAEHTPVHGEYRVTAITHHLSGTGEYTNTFEAIPIDNNYIPVTIQKPIAETQMAIVKDNKDPEHVGRVRVQMIWQEEKGELTDWIRVLTPDAGSSDKVNKNRGFVFIPEVGDQVLLGFRYNDPNRPFVLGSIFHGKTASGGGTSNGTKSIATRSGNKLELNDERGSVYLTDKGGAFTFMDGDGNVTTNANSSSTMNVGAKDGKAPTSVFEMDAEGNILLDGKISITFRVGENSITISKEGIKGKVEEGDMNFNAATGKFIIHSKGDMDVSTDENLMISGGPEAVISSQNTNMI
jgi:type VI secretion system secreted protein VgrG